MLERYLFSGPHAAKTLRTRSARARSISAGGTDDSGDITASAKTALSAFCERVHRDGAAAQLDDRLRTRMHVQCPENRADVHLDRSFGQAEIAADQLVRLSLREELQHFGLPLRETEALRWNVGGVRAAVCYVDGDAAPAAEHGANGVEQRVGARCFGDVAARAGRERGAHRRAIMRGRQHDDRHARIIEAKLGEQIKPPRAGKGEVEENERAIGIARERGQRLVTIGRRDHIEARIDERQRLFERAHDQRMVVDDENFVGDEQYNATSES